MRQEVAGPYHAVVIAAPLEHSHIKFRGLKLAPRPRRHYQQVVTTYVVGLLQASYFGVETLPTGEYWNRVPARREMDCEGFGLCAAGHSCGLAASLGLDYSCKGGERRMVAMCNCTV